MELFENIQMNPVVAGGRYLLRLETKDKLHVKPGNRLHPDAENSYAFIKIFLSIDIPEHLSEMIAINTVGNSQW